MKKNNKEILTIIIGTIITIAMVFLILFTMYKISTNKIPDDKANQNNIDNTNISNNTDISNTTNNPDGATDENNTNNPDLSSGVSETTPNKITAYIFIRNTCPHCHNAINFFQSILKDYDYLEVQTFEITDNSNATLLSKVADKFNVSAITSVPLIMIGQNYILNSYNNTYNERIIAEIEKASKDYNYEDLIETILNESPNLKVNPEIIQK